MKNKYKYAGLALTGLLAPALLFAQGTAVAAPAPAPYIDFGNTAWMIVATALVMLMTIPGLALFLWRTGSSEECFKHPDAVFYINCSNHP